MMNLTLTRRGKFIVEETEDDSYQCGVRGSREFHYTVRISCPPLLDSRGFLVDQLEIHQAITERYRRLPTFVSCELLAMDCAEMLLKMAPTATKIIVELGTGELAGITCELSNL